jgi:hypothetical protein
MIHQTIGDADYLITGWCALDVEIMKGKCKEVE